jgi:hypothetical protein
MGWVGMGGRCVKESNAPFLKLSSQALDSPANAPFLSAVPVLGLASPRV